MGSVDQNLNGVEFLNDEDYLNDLREELSIPFSELKIICFKMVYDRILRTILPSIERGLEDGVKVDIHVDAIFSRYRITQGFSPFYDNGQEKEVIAEELTRKLFDTLKSKGASITYFNEPGWFNLRVFPFWGRDHRKIVFIKRDNGEKICYFGATNMDDGGHNDFMIKVTDEETLQILEKICDYDHFSNLEEDQIYEINDQLKIVLDIGHCFRSKIQSRGYSLMRNAKSKIIFVSQLPSEPPLLLQFIKARLRGVEVEIIVPNKQHENLASFPYILVFWTMLIAKAIFGIRIFHCVRDFTHAKILIADDKVLLGSHNLSSTGVAAGTVELSAEVNNKNFFGTVMKFVDSLRDPDFLEERNVLLQPDFKLLENRNSPK